MSRRSIPSRKRMQSEEGRLLRSGTLAILHASACKIGGYLKGYTFTKKWTHDVVDHSTFHCQSSTQTECHFPDRRVTEVHNSGSIPPALKIGTVYAPANAVTVGASKSQSYGLNSQLIQELHESVNFRLQDDSKLSQYHYQGRTASGDGSMLLLELKKGVNTVGDVRATLKKSMRPGSLSIVAMQDEDGHLVAGSMKGSKINWLRAGSVSFDEIILAKMSENESSTMGIRIVGFLLVWLALYFITDLLATMPNLIPCIGPMISDIVGCMLCFMNFFVAAACSALVIAVAWLMARPLWAAAALGLVCLLMCGAGAVFRSAKSKAGGEKLMDEASKAENGYGTQVEAGVPAYAATPAVAIPAAAPIQAVAVAQPIPQTQVTVTCPDGSAPGTLVKVPLADGRLVQVQVPEGVLPGQPFLVTA
ncbi:unnamed protein product [Effrenium voratum]|nr:unnamed protein product [Effrenium voratum]